MMSTLPQPDHDAKQRSQQLVGLLKNIIQEQGSLSYTQFMQLALYTPELGYYSSPQIKFGKDGDFITAPEISPLYSQCIARQCIPVLKALPQASILEFGAGAGTMAADILAYLEKEQQLPHYYYILELSAGLQAQQYATLQQRVPHLLDKVQWLQQLPTELSGIILANEVLDAMPVVRFRYHQQQLEYSAISWQQQLLESWHPLATNSEEQRYIASLPLNPDQDYTSEFNPQLTAWIHTLSDSLQQGLILLIDYGFPQHEYYHPERHQGTLMCHYRHYAHGDSLWYPGLQDITAHVDFTAVAEAGYQAGLTVAGYTDQASFLLSCGLTTLAEQLNPHSDKERIQISQQLQTLTMPMEMGELFKVLALTRGIDDLPLLGFQLDKRHRL